VFFTGTAAEVTPVRSVDHYTVGAGRRGPITGELQTAYLEAVRKGHPEHDWLTHVTSAGQEKTSQASAEAMA
jgi:branched-chain amino acid aminotransferase